MKRVIINGNKNIIKLCCDKKIVFFLSTSLIYGYSKKTKMKIHLKNPLINIQKLN